MILDKTKLFSIDTRGCDKDQFLKIKEKLKEQGFIATEVEAEGRSNFYWDSEKKPMKSLKHIYYTTNYNEYHSERLKNNVLTITGSDFLKDYVVWLGQDNLNFSESDQLPNNLEFLSQNGTWKQVVNSSNSRVFKSLNNKTYYRYLKLDLENSNEDKYDYWNGAEVPDYIKSLPYSLEKCTNSNDWTKSCLAGLKLPLDNDYYFANNAKYRYLKSEVNKPENASEDIFKGSGWYITSSGRCVELDGFRTCKSNSGFINNDYRDCSWSWNADGSIRGINPKHGNIEDWFLVSETCEPPKLNDDYEHLHPPEFRVAQKGDYFLSDVAQDVRLCKSNEKSLTRWIVKKKQSKNVESDEYITWEGCNIPFECESYPANLECMPQNSDKWISSVYKGRKVIETQLNNVKYRCLKSEIPEQKKVEKSIDTGKDYYVWSGKDIPFQTSIFPKSLECRNAECAGEWSISCNQGDKTQLGCLSSNLEYRCLKSDVEELMASESDDKYYTWKGRNIPFKVSHLCSSLEYLNPTKNKWLPSYLQGLRNNPLYLSPSIKYRCLKSNVNKSMNNKTETPKKDEYIVWNFGKEPDNLPETFPKSLELKTSNGAPWKASVYANSDNKHYFSNTYIKRFKYRCLKSELTDDSNEIVITFDTPSCLTSINTLKGCSLKEATLKSLTKSINCNDCIFFIEGEELTPDSILTKSCKINVLPKTSKQNPLTQSKEHTMLLSLLKFSAVRKGLFWWFAEPAKNVGKLTVTVMRYASVVGLIGGSFYGGHYVYENFDIPKLSITFEKSDA